MRRISLFIGTILFLCTFSGCKSKEEKFKESEETCFRATQQLLEIEFQAYQNSCQAYDKFISETASELDWLIQLSDGDGNSTGIHKDTPLYVKDRWFTNVQNHLPYLAKNPSPALSTWISNLQSGLKGVRNTLNHNFNSKTMEQAFEQYLNAGSCLEELKNGSNPGQADSLLRLRDMALYTYNVFWRYQPESAYNIGPITVGMTDSITNAQEYLSSYKSRYGK
ncbi:MAG: hypothetical protein HDR87_08010 [Bacteroides sp.]|nr:hypothetical protein [Bacteroides sp.]